MNYIKISQYGVVVGSGVCQPEDAHLVPLGPGETLIPDTPQPPSRDTICRYVDGQIVDTGQPVLAPHPWMIWNDTQFCWVDGRDLDEHKAFKWEEIKAARSTAEYAGFVWDGSTFDSDLVSQQKIMGAVQLAGLNPLFTVDWTLADNTVRTLSASEMAAVGVALGTHVETQYVIARGLRDQIAAAQTTAEVDAIVWPIPPQ